MCTVKLLIIDYVGPYLLVKMLQKRSFDGGDGNIVLVINLTIIVFGAGFQGKTVSGSQILA